MLIWGSREAPSRDAHADELVENGKAAPNIHISQPTNVTTIQSTNQSTKQPINQLRGTVAGLPQAVGYIFLLLRYLAAYFQINWAGGMLLIHRSFGPQCLGAWLRKSWARDAIHALRPDT